MGAFRCPLHLLFNSKLKSILFIAFNMDPINPGDPLEELEIFLDDSESGSDNGPDLEPPPDSAPQSPVLEASSSSSQPDAPRESHNSIGAKIQALTRFADGVPHEKITAQTGVSRSGLYKLRAKAVSRGWDPDGGILETWHVDGAPRPRRPKTSTATALFIIETTTKNSTTRGWSCARIAAEVSNTPGRQPVSQSTVYRVLTENGYGV
jgi:hypothetical protein